MTTPLSRFASDSAKRFLVGRTEANNSATSAVIDTSDRENGTGLLDRHVELGLSRDVSPIARPRQWFEKPVRLVRRAIALASRS